MEYINIVNLTRACKMQIPQLVTAKSLHTNFLFRRLLILDKDQTMSIQCYMYSYSQ